MTSPGWCGTLLEVDLTAGTVRRRTIPRTLLHERLGGRGLGIALMRGFVSLDPFDPHIPLVMAVGPLCGTPAPTAARLSVVSRSPLTGTIFDCSAGGRFAWRLKGCGLDAIRISGRSSRPVILSVRGGEASIEPADTLWGKGVSETVSLLGGSGSVAAIGPAGENGVLYASIVMGEGNAVGRGGLGSVMGAKNLKGVVVDGTPSVSIADRLRFDRARADVLRLFRASPVVMGEFGISRYGTPALVDLILQRRMTPTENFRKSWFEGGRSLGGAAIRRLFEPVDSGCYGCPIQCKKMTKEREHLPEYETVSHFGALNGVSDLAAIVRSNTLCNELGMDTISAAATIAAWGEHRGRFPAPEEIPPLLSRIASRSGEGKTLSLGSRRFADSVGRPEISMSVKGLELPAYDPRGSYGMALAYAVSNRGGCHLRAYPISMEILRKPVAVDRFSFAGKARQIAIAENVNAAVDSLIACKFGFLGATLEEYGELLSAVTGEEYTAQRLKEIGAGIVREERYMNSCNGFSSRDDTLPERFFTEPGTGGEGIEVPPIDRLRFLEERGKYYRIRGADDDGVVSTFPGGGEPI